MAPTTDLSYVRSDVDDIITDCLILTWQYIEDWLYLEMGGGSIEFLTHDDKELGLKDTISRAKREVPSATSAAPFLIILNYIYW